MTAIAANSPDVSLRRFIAYSLILHGLLLTWIGISAFWNWHGPEWTGAGAAGDSVNVTLVGSAGIPMPQPPTRKSRVFENKTPTPENAVPGPATGAPRLNTGYTATPGTNQGVAVQGQGGGDFASRYAWYIEAVKRRVQGNWQQYTIDPAVRAARNAHAVVQFTILRDGTVKDILLTQSSGNLSMDNSGLRAVMASNPMPALPNDYSGSYVRAIFDFDLSLTR